LLISRLWQLMRSHR
jgi:alaS: alanine--tRNA ligase